MGISINHLTRVITIPQADLTFVSAGLYELDVNALRLTLKELEADSDGMTLLDTHRHNTQIALAGATFARTFEIINSYTVTFEDGQYAVRCVGANHNIGDVKNVNQVSLIIGNSAGLVVTDSGAGDWSTTEKQQIRHRLGVDGASAPPAALPDLPVNVSQIYGSTLAATHLCESATMMQLASVDATALVPTATKFDSSIVVANPNHFKRRLIFFRSGNLLRQASEITQYSLVAGRGRFIVGGFTAAPSHGDTFIIV